MPAFKGLKAHAAEVPVEQDLSQHLRLLLNERSAVSSTAAI
jgi:hypothetical protein